MKGILATLIMFSFLAGAQAVELQKWEVELNKYAENLKDDYRPMLAYKFAQEFSFTAASCGSSIVLVVASFAADTVPVVTLGSELIANTIDEEYKSLGVEEDVSTWGRSADGARGLLGGVPSFALDLAEYFVNWLAGDTEGGWVRVKKVYASSMTTYTKLSADEAACQTNMLHFGAVINELLQR